MTTSTKKIIAIRTKAVFSTTLHCRQGRFYISCGKTRPCRVCSTVAAPRFAHQEEGTPRRAQRLERSHDGCGTVRWKRGGTPNGLLEEPMARGTLCGTFVEHSVNTLWKCCKSVSCRLPLLGSVWHPCEPRAT